MNTIIIIAVAMILIGAVAYIVHLVMQQMKLIMGQVNETSRRVDDRLKENSQMIDRTHRSIGERLDTAAKVVGRVTEKMTALEESNKKIHDVGKDIASLQEILRAPKLRGGLGELLLENVLKQILPQRELYSLQYAFKSGEKVDAAIHLSEGKIVSVDAKFPLENFRHMLDAQAKNDEKMSESYRKLFVTDVKKHVDAIAKKYIMPSEGTLDFALMYIPAENVYYETITKELDAEESLAQYALSRKVIPVSPNTFYIYMQTLLLGLRGLQIERQAGQILAHLSQLKQDFGKFFEEYELVGTHLLRAKGSYEKSSSRLERFSERLNEVESPRQDGEQKMIE